MESIFTKNTKEALAEFITRWAAIEEIDQEKALALAASALVYYKAGKKARAEQRPNQELEKRWYASLTAGEPDYSVYGDQYFLSDIWACWMLYSRKYLLNIQKNCIGKSIDVQNVGSVVDLGCGFGYTTAALKELFPNAEVYGTNFEGGIQWKFAEQVGSERGFTLAPDVHKLDCQIDLIFASEYFEHIENPVEHLEDLLKTCKPKYIICANAFGTTSVGHFDDYKHNDAGLFGNLISGKKIGREFNRALRAAGYSKVKTGCWNDRPNLWKNN
jgi:SAM-dependent methyltransferase